VLRAYPRLVRPAWFAAHRDTQSVRLDEAKLEELRRWGQALRGAGSEESVAAGRAILMLIEELERLRLELWRVREQLERVEPVSENEADAGTGEPVASTLHGRLRRVLGRDSDQSPEARPESLGETGPSAENDAETTSAQSWIETLRQQK
jgi:hypothetical protein